MFSDPWNPSSTEVRMWAHDPAAVEPCQAWNLALSWAWHERDYLEFASDPKCPKRVYFLRVIYFMVGDAVHSQFKKKPEPVVRGFVELAANHKSRDLRLWRERSLRLLRHPGEFEYNSWCAGGHARDAA